MIQSLSWVANSLLRCFKACIWLQMAMIQTLSWLWMQIHSQAPQKDASLSCIGPGRPWILLLQSAAIWQSRSFSIEALLILDRSKILLGILEEEYACKESRHLICPRVRLKRCQALKCHSTLCRIGGDLLPELHKLLHRCDTFDSFLNNRGHLFFWAEN